MLRPRQPGNLQPRQLCKAPTQHKQRNKCIAQHSPDVLCQRHAKAVQDAKNHAKELDAEAKAARQAAAKTAAEGGCSGRQISPIRLSAVNELADVHGVCAQAQAVQDAKDHAKELDAEAKAARQAAAKAAAEGGKAQAALEAQRAAAAVHQAARSDALEAAAMAQV